MNSLLKEIGWPISFKKISFSLYTSCFISWYVEINFVILSFNSMLFSMNELWFIFSFTKESFSSNIILFFTKSSFILGNIINKLLIKSFRNMLFPVILSCSISIKFFPTILNPFAFNILRMWSLELNSIYIISPYFIFWCCSYSDILLYL